MKAFWFHYNKPMSLRDGRPRITVHFDGMCHLVDNVDIEVPTKGRIRKEQPRFVMTGKGYLSIQDGVFYAV